MKKFVFWSILHKHTNIALTEDLSKYAQGETFWKAMQNLAETLRVWTPSTVTEESDINSRLKMYYETGINKVEILIDKEKDSSIKIIGKIDIDTLKGKKPKKEEEPEEITKDEIEEGKIISKPVTDVTEKIPKPKKIESEKLTELKKRAEDNDYEVKVLGKIDLDSMNQKTRPARKSKEEKEKERLAKKTAKVKTPAKSKKVKAKVKEKPVEKVDIPKTEPTKKEKFDQLFK